LTNGKRRGPQGQADQGPRTQICAAPCGSRRGPQGQADQGRRERGVLCTRATEDADMRSALRVTKPCGRRQSPCRGQSPRPF
jgi:hypothetical protein